MSKEAIVIKVSDNIPNSIKIKLNGITKSSELAQKSLKQLKKTLKGITADPFKKYLNSINTFTEFLNLANTSSDILVDSLNEISNIGDPYQHLTQSIKDLSKNFSEITDSTDKIANPIEYVIILLNKLSNSISNILILNQNNYDFFKNMSSAVNNASRSFLLISEILQEMALQIANITNPIVRLNTIFRSLINSCNELVEIFETIIDSIADFANSSIEAGNNQRTFNDQLQSTLLTALGLDNVVKIFQLLVNYFEMLKLKGDDIGQIVDVFKSLEEGVREYVIELDDALGISDKLSNAILWLSEHIKDASTALTILGTAYLTATGYTALFVSGVDALGTKTLPTAIAQLKAFTAALAANPVGFVIMSIASLIATLTLFSDEIKVTEDDSISLKDVFITVWGDIKNAIKDVISMLGSAWDWFVDKIGNSCSSSAEIIFNYTKKVFSRMVDVLLLPLNKIIAAVKIVIAIITYSFDDMSIGWEVVWKTIVNSLIDYCNDIIDYFKGLLRKLAYLISFANEDIAKALNDKVDSMTFKIDKIEFSKKAEGAARDFSKKLGDIWNDDHLGGLIKQGFNYFNNVVSRTKENKKLNNNGMDNKPKDIESSVRELTDKENRLLNKLDPSRAAILEYVKALDSLNMIYKDGLIDLSQYNNYVTLLKNKYEESMNPLGYYNKELNRQWELMKLSSQQRAIENELYRINQDMMSKGIVLSQSQNDELRKSIALNEKKNRITGIKDSLQNNSQYKKNQDFNEFTEGLVDLKQNDENFTQGDVINALNTDNKSPFVGMFGGFGLLQEQVAQYQLMYDQIDQLRNNDLISEENALSLKAQVWAKQNDVILGQAGNFFGQLAQLQNSSNSTMARVGKAAAIAQAIISTYTSANDAYKAMVGIPVVGPALAKAAAAAAIAAGMANVAAIRSQSTGYMAGGYTGHIARNQIAGVVHGQEFVMNASATQRIGINNLEALQRGDMNDFQSPQMGNNYTKVNTEDSVPQAISPVINIALVSDTETAEQWLSTQEGIKQIMQINRDNGSELATIVNAV